MEKDDKAEFGNAVYDYGFRIYNPKIGKFLIVDTLTKELPSYSPYNYAANRPIDGIDLDGLSWVPVIDNRGNNTGFKWTDAAPNPANNIYALALHIREIPGAFDRNSEYNMGSAIITVYGENKGDIYSFAGTSLPARLEDYATIDEGLHTAQLGYHKQTKDSRYLALRINNGKNSPVKNNWNPYTELTYATGVNAHKAGLGNKTGLTTNGDPISMACILIDRNRWDEFINIFDETSSRQEARKGIISARLFICKMKVDLGMPAILNTSITPATFTKKDETTVKSPLPNPTIGVGINRSLIFPTPDIGKNAYEPFTWPTNPNENKTSDDEKKKG